MGDLQDDLNRNLPSSKIDILAINEEGQESANSVAAAINDLPLLQDTVAEDAWGSWGAEWRDVHVVDAAGEVTNVLNLTRNDLRVPANYSNLRGMIVEAATANRVAESPWQNAVEPLDANQDGFVAPNDALTVINRINREGAGELPAPNGEPTSYYDATGDNFVSSLDALRIIQVLNRFSSRASGEPNADESSAPTSSNSVAADAYFAWNAAEQDADDDESDEK